jgi:methionyl-tRNA synthetase
LARIRDGLKDVPISRTGGAGWGIKVPGHEEHTIYVWIDALFNYVSAVDTDERRHYWPADVHLMGKDILWFHAVIWPAMLLALGKLPGKAWLVPPRRIHAHAFWIREGEKMSKSMDNFVDLAELRAYVAQFGVDALRYYIVASGPFGAGDSDFARDRFIETYNTDLANTVGNCSSRVSNMLARYFGGVVPAPSVAFDALRTTVEALGQRGLEQAEDLQIDAMVASALELVRVVDRFIQETEPFRLIKTEGKQDEVGSILYHAAEALRISSLLLWPVMPERMSLLWQRFGCQPYGEALRDRQSGRIGEWLKWGGLLPGARVEHGEPLFPRIIDPVAVPAARGRGC